MPIRKYIGGSVFGPETIAHMMSAFESARTILNLNDPNDPMVETVAKKVVSLASQGITDPAQIARLIVADSNKERKIRIDIRDDYELRYWTKRAKIAVGILPHRPRGLRDMKRVSEFFVHKNELLVSFDNRARCRWTQQDSLLGVRNPEQILSLSLAQ